MSTCEIKPNSLENSDFTAADVGQKPLMIYDGDCGFCLHWMRKWAVWTGNRIPWATSQTHGALFAQVPADTYDRAVVFVNEAGEWWEGAGAINETFRRTQTFRLFTLLFAFAPARWFINGGYRFVANNRRLFSKLTFFFSVK